MTIHTKPSRVFVFFGRIRCDEYAVDDQPAVATRSPKDVFIAAAHGSMAMLFLLLIFGTLVDGLMFERLTVRADLPDAAGPMADNDAQSSWVLPPAGVHDLGFTPRRVGIRDASDCRNLALIFSDRYRDVDVRLLPIVERVLDAVTVIETSIGWMECCLAGGEILSDGMCLDTPPPWLWPEATPGVELMPYMIDVGVDHGGEICREDGKD